LSAGENALVNLVGKDSSKVKTVSVDPAPGEHVGTSSCPSLRGRWAGDLVGISRGSEGENGEECRDHFYLS